MNTKSVNRTLFRAMTESELRTMYLQFFAERGHAIIPSASLVPENDSSVLFTTAGMHPLVPFLLGQKHPRGVRLADCQKCVRTNDLEEVGDLTHLTFFEMLGNWSLGDYYKNEAITWSYEFLTGASTLNIPKDAIWVTCFEGDELAPRDTEAAEIWKNLGVPEERIVFLGAEHNWWAAGTEGPCGPDTEIFIDMTCEACDRGNECLPGVCDCGRFFEIWNNVFMSYNRQGGIVTPLAQRNVDTGMGLERTLAALNGVDNVYEINSFRFIRKRLLSHSTYNEDEVKADTRLVKASRILADHLRTSVFILGDERKIVPSNQGQGYVLRRLIRRAVRYCSDLNIDPKDWVSSYEAVIGSYADHYPELLSRSEEIFEELEAERARFERTLNHGAQLLDKELKKLILAGEKVLSGEVAFHLYDTFGFPLEFTQEISSENQIDVDVEGFTRASSEHRDASRSIAAKSGLADDTRESVKYHTATHLLHAALRKILGQNVEQRGSNINKERMRFDFSYPLALTSEQLEQVQTLVQSWIEQGLEVTQLTLSAEEARAMGAIGLFADKYGDVVSVYKIGDISLEFCGGPHVANTSEVRGFKIEKEQSSGAGVRRIRAITPQ